MDQINGLSAAGQMQMRPPRENATLTEEQITQAQEIISKYDAESMTPELRREMREELRTAGIRPGEDLKGILEDEGFEVGKAGKSGGPPPPPGGQTEQDPAVTAFIEKYESGELTEDDIASLIDLLKQRGEETSGVLVDETA